MPLILAAAGVATSIAMGATIIALNAGRAIVPRVSSPRRLPMVVIDTLTLDGLPHLEASARLAVRRLEDSTDLRWRGIVLAPRPNGAEDDEMVLEVGPTRSTSWVASISIGEEIELNDEIETPDPHDDIQHRTNEHGEIVGCVARFDPMLCEGRDLDRIIAHELVHGQGFEHVTARLGRKNAENRHVRWKIPKTGHLMHPDYSEGGWGMEGLPGVITRRDERREEREERREERRARKEDR